MDVRGWLAPLAASLAVLAVLAGTWTLVGPDHRARPNQAARTPLPSPVGGVIGGPPRTPAPSPTRPLTNPEGVAIDRYSVVDRTHLLVSYTLGVNCSGLIRRPLVQESSTSVTITLTRKPVHDSGGTSSQSCPDVALMEAVPVSLRAPLGRRAVLDGATGGTPVPRGPRPPPA